MCACLCKCPPLVYVWSLSCLCLVYVLPCLCLVHVLSISFLFLAYVLPMSCLCLVYVYVLRRYFREFVQPRNILDMNEKPNC